jgi:hypothetical protein
MMAISISRAYSSMDTQVRDFSLLRKFVDKVGCTIHACWGRSGVYSTTTWCPSNLF